MRPKSMILIVIALGCGLVAAMGISQVLNAKGNDGRDEIEMTEVFVAATEVNLGDVLAKEMLKLEAWPSDRVPEGALSSLEDVEGQRPNQRLYAGEVILQAKLIDGNGSDGATDKIPVGYVAHTIDVEVSDTGSGLLRPGDRVDILVYLRQSCEIGKARAKRVLQNVRVFAVDDRITRDTEDGVVKAKTVTLLVKPGQDELLLLADEKGTLRLVMRRGDDQEAESTTGKDVNELLGDAEVADDGAKSCEPKTNQFLDFLGSLKTKPTAPLPTGTNEEFKMVLVGPQSAQVWQFGEEGEMPIDVTADLAANYNNRNQNQTQDIGSMFDPGMPEPDDPSVDDPPAEDDAVTDD